MARRPANERWAVLVNEFGQVGLDAALLSRDEDGIAIGEVAGGAARLVEAASDAEAWAQALQEVLVHSEVRQTLRQAGLIRAQQFSNEASAQRLLAVYREVMAT